jgi:hypothetical protein
MLRTRPAHTTRRTIPRHRRRLGAGRLCTLPRAYPPRDTRCHPMVLSHPVGSRRRTVLRLRLARRMGTRHILATRMLLHMDIGRHLHLEHPDTSCLPRCRRPGSRRHRRRRARRCPRSRSTLRRRRSPRTHVRSRSRRCPRAHARRRPHSRTRSRATARSNRSARRCASRRPSRLEPSAGPRARAARVPLRHAPSCPLRKSSARCRPSRLASRPTNQGRRRALARAGSSTRSRCRRRCRAASGRSGLHPRSPKPAHLRKQRRLVPRYCWRRGAPARTRGTPSRCTTSDTASEPRAARAQAPGLSTCVHHHR